jgi:hypothetical protein
MRRRLAILLATGVLALTAGPTLGHHSFAMFDRNNQIDLEGVLQEFRFSNPHTFIYLAVKQDDGSTITWSLEGHVSLRRRGPMSGYAYVRNGSFATDAAGLTGLATLACRLLPARLDTATRRDCQQTCAAKRSGRCLGANLECRERRL